MIDPQTVLVGIPCHDGRVMTELCGMLIMNGRKFGSMTLPTECSHPSLVRNIIADTFLRSPFQWLVGIDSDIVPGPADWDFLLQEIDPEARYSSIQSDNSELAPPEPTRLEITNDAGTRTMADALVCAEYAYKEDDFRPVQFGGGFYRVHRSVFLALQALTHPDNGRVEIDRALWEALTENLDSEDLYARVEAIRATMTSQAGTPRLWQASFKGRVFYDYYPSGPLITTHLAGGSEWKGEDHGFWTLCHLAGLIPRIERRTRLVHIGRKGYPYLGPDEGVQQ